MTRPQYSPQYPFDPTRERYLHIRIERPGELKACVLSSIFKMAQLPLKDLVKEEVCNRFIVALELYSIHLMT